MSEISRPVARQTEDNNKLRRGYRIGTPEKGRFGIPLLGMIEQSEHSRGKEGFKKSGFRGVM
jgi:hypothetical protein